MNFLLREALAHLDRNFAVLPVRPDKEPRSDLIRRTRGTPSWRQLVKRPATAVEVCDWFEADPTVGIGVLTGEVSNVVVVDIDNPASAPSLPTTATVTTQRGVHGYFRASGPVRTREFPWGEIRGEGAYVLAPCTRRSDGGAYAWEFTPEDAGIVDFAVFKNSAASPYIRTTSLLRSTCPRRVLEGLQGLANLELDESVALRLATALGAPESLRVGEAFPCLIHPDGQPSASLWRHRSDVHVLYKDWHAAKHGGVTWLPLAGVRARIAGRDGPLNAPELAIWKLRLAREAQLFDPLALERPAAPNRRTDAVWQGFLDLLALRWTIEPGIPTTYSARFAAAWCNTTKRNTHEAINELARAGSLRLVGRDARGTRLWMPEGVRPIA